MVYPPQAGHDGIVKDLFYENLRWTLTKFSASEMLFVCGDFNWHIGNNVDGYEVVYGDRGFGKYNLEGKRFIEFAVPHNLIVSNSLFLSIWWKSKSNWLHPGEATELQNSALCESHLKWRVCNLAQTTCLWCKNSKKWRFV